jgi:hypothetical protein
MRVCIYTSIYGNYDHLLQPVAQSIDCDFLCFTDAPWPARDGAWRVIRSNRNPSFHPRMRAKYFRCMNHEVFPNGRLAWRYAPFARRPRYDYIIWIDGCLRIKSPTFAAEFIAHVGEHGLAMFIHPDRDCIYDELQASIGMRKYRGLKLPEQVEAYRAEGYPEHAGLMATTLIARRVGHPMHEAVNIGWWNENLKWTYQDQLSLPVVLWRLNHTYDPVRLYLWDNPWFDRLEHTSDL